MTAREQPANAFLLGGPPHISKTERTRVVDNPSEVVKLRHGNQYEHFTPTGEQTEADEGTLLVFRWSGCTRVAE
ncbi:DUF5988 family protein [Amycolatopsis sp.]|uniref:DUF5988 family protein n=1 Tax=Amycolatopsis sp. TaxID=37632 RepID=UPI002D7E936F|nr:DUF5988 family protein [Amycolatopsis sp.]HET6707839.1 DUF5988 family protein [Amycolatopsis sp.]